MGRDWDNSNRNPRNRRAYQGRRPQKKHSGAKEGQTKKGKLYVYAWNYSRDRGLIKIKAFENKKTTFSTSERGNEFATLMFEIFYTKTGNKLLEIAPYNLTTGKVFLEQLGIVISTKAPNGGYCGRK